MEACLGLPQLWKNYVKKSTEGMRCVYCVSTILLLTPSARMRERVTVVCLSFIHSFIHSVTLSTADLKDDRLLCLER